MRRPFHATVAVPGDKSVSHRALLLGALADGDSRIEGFLRAGDTLRTLSMVRALGVEVVEETPTTLRVRGRGLQGLREPAGVIDAGPSGTTMRIGAGMLAAQPFLSVLTGDRRLARGSLANVVDPLTAMGARVKGSRGRARPPLSLGGRRLRGLRYASPVASAQVKGAVLLAGLCGGVPVAVEEPARSRDHAERMLAAMGAPIRVEDTRVSLDPVDRLDPFEARVPADLSSAAFFLVLAACTPHATMRVTGVGLNPLRTGVLDVLGRMGARVGIENVRVDCGEPVGDVRIVGAPLSATAIGADEIPRIENEVPALCVAAALATGRTEVRGAAELRHQDSDRIGAMVAAFQALGIPCGALPDGLWIEGRAVPRPAACDTRGDHRVAMALAILSAATGVSIGLSDTACIDASFPGFLDRVAALQP